MEMQLTIANNHQVITKDNLLPEGCKIQAYSLHDQFSDKYLNIGSHAPCTAHTALTKIKKYTKEHGGVNAQFDLLRPDGSTIRSTRSYSIKHGDLIQPYKGSDVVLKPALTTTPKPINQPRKVRHI